MCASSQTRYRHSLYPRALKGLRAISRWCRMLHPSAPANLYAPWLLNVEMPAPSTSWWKLTQDDPGSSQLHPSLRGEESHGGQISTYQGPPRQMANRLGHEVIVPDFFLGQCPLGPVGSLNSHDRRTVEQPPALSHTMYQLDSFGKSTPPQNRQSIVYYY